MASQRELELSRELSGLSSRISAVAESFVRHVEVDAGETELVGQLAGQLAELAENVGSLSASLSIVRSRMEAVLLSKVAADTMRCVECGTEYGAEPGPHLCGPCWLKLGKPATWKSTPGVGLYVLPTADRDGLHRWHPSRNKCCGLFPYSNPLPAACPGCGDGGTRDAC